MHARLCGSKSLSTLYQIADEIAEPHPDMNIKVLAFTVSEKPSNSLKKKKHSYLLWLEALLATLLNMYVCEK